MPGYSYFFTLYKKLQVLGHVPEKTQHGVGAGGFNLSNPLALFGSSDKGALLGPTLTPADSPVWAVLNSRASGNAGFDPVNVNGTVWPTMPLGSGSNPPSWNEFQVSAPDPKLVAALGTWVGAGKINDVPSAVLSQVPPAMTRKASGVIPFVCSMAGDNGTAPVPNNFWATSLIWLLNPANGAIANPAQLAAASEYYLAAVVGNRGSSKGGRFAQPAGPKVESEGWVMVWNTGMSPAVRLPSLSNLNLTSTSGSFESYFLDGGTYDVVGFRLPVQTVFDGLVAAIANSDIDLGGSTPQQWVHEQGAHLCCKVRVRKEGEAWPALSASPFDDRRIAQKNLAPFAATISVTDTDPEIDWENFMVGDAHAFARIRWHELRLRTNISRKAARIYLAIPERTWNVLNQYNQFPNFEVITQWSRRAPKPFPNCVILRHRGGTNPIVIPPLGERRFLAMSIGVDVLPRTTPGYLGEVSVEHTTMLSPCRDDARRKVIVGGFTLRVSVTRDRLRSV